MKETRAGEALIDEKSKNEVQIFISQTFYIAMHHHQIPSVKSVCTHTHTHT
jgi:hypothetical protein